MILVEFYKNRGRYDQEIPERGCGRVSNYWKPLTQTTKALKQRMGGQQDGIQLLSLIIEIHDMHYRSPSAASTTESPGYLTLNCF